MISNKYKHKYYKTFNINIQIRLLRDTLRELFKHSLIHINLG